MDISTADCYPFRVEVLRDIDLFLKASCLGDYYDDASLLESKVTEILEWLEKCYREYGTIIRVDFVGQSLLAQQFFTSSKFTLDVILELLTKNAWFEKRKMVDSPEKVTLDLKAVELKARSQVLQNQLRYNNQVFTNSLDLRLFSQKAEETDTGILVHVCCISHDDTVVSMTVMKKPKYMKIESILKARKISMNHLTEIDMSKKRVSKKRHIEPPYMDKIKRMRRSREEEPDPTVSVIRLVITPLARVPDLTHRLTCIVCDTEKLYTQFYYKTKAGAHKENNICHTCLKKNTRWKTEQNKLK